MAAFLRILAGLLVAITVLFVLPLGTHAVWWMSREDMPSRWSTADWSSTGLLPGDPAAVPDALVRVYAARTGRWRGIVAHHTWIVVKEEGAARYSRFDKVGWGSPIRRDGWAPDARWYSNEPELVLALDGEAARAAVPAIRAAVDAYPWNAYGDYRAWPGPNSNTFVAWVLDHAARDVPALAVALPPTALGKDWTPAADVALATDGVGLRASLSGLAGARLGWADGVEINFLGLVAGVDVRTPALKLPGWGRLGFDDGRAVAAEGGAEGGAEGAVGSDR